VGAALHLHWRCLPASARQNPLCDAHMLLPCGGELQVSTSQLHLLRCWLRCVEFAAAAAPQRAPQPRCVQSPPCLSQTQQTTTGTCNKAL
jgi:hypothetical protein